jgi:transposase
MDRDKRYLGIDISKDVFDVCDENQEFHQFKNTVSGFKSLLKLLDNTSHCVMEATGYYHVQLAYFLVENSITTSVVNPLKIKRFGQMKLSKIKTDKSDAKLIQEYASQMNPSEWFGESKKHQEDLQLSRLLGIYTKQSTQLKNKIHGEEVLGNPSKKVVQSLKRQLKNLQKEMQNLEQELLKSVKESYQEPLTLLKSIPGIGEKTAVHLLVLTAGFSRFENYKQLCSYAGITPIIRESGSSVKGKPRISKIGNVKLRNLLFLCSFNACKYNRACKALYERIVAKGKSKKLALIAVCNKLLKQAFSIVKNGLPYDDNFRSTLAKN